MSKDYKLGWLIRSMDGAKNEIMSRVALLDLCQNQFLKKL
jgi:hypothetical protein